MPEKKAGAQEEVDALRAETKAALLEQETRPITLVQNLIAHWSPNENTTEAQSLAAKKAFFGALVRYIIFSRALGATGGVLGLIGLLVAVFGLLLHQRTVEEMAVQSKLLADDLQEARRATNVMAFADLVRDLDTDAGDGLTELMALRVYTVSEALVPYQTPAFLFRVSEQDIAPELFRPEDSIFVSPQRGALLLAVHQHLRNSTFPLRPNFTSALLINGVFTGSNLGGIQLSRSVLDFAYLDSCDLSESDMIDSRLRYARLFDSNLSGVDFSGSDMILADLSGAQIEGAIFSNALMEGAQLRRIDPAHAEGLCQARTLYQAEMDDMVAEVICAKCPEKLSKGPGIRSVSHIVGEIGKRGCP